MTSSGIKRGVAATAISALAVAGLPLFAGTASAEPNAAQYGTEEIQLLSQYSGGASTKNDGQNTTVRLEAGAGSAITSVTFQVQGTGDAGYQNIGVATRNDDGAFSLEWTATDYVGDTVSLRAFETGSDPLVTGDERLLVAVTGNGALAPDSVNITNGSTLRTFSEPYDNATAETAGSQVLAGVIGTTSQDEGDDTINLVHFFGNPDGEPAGTADVDDDGNFGGVANLEGYDFTGSPDQITLGADTGDTDDTEAFTVVQQSIDEVTATPTNSNIPEGDPDPEITVTVLDTTDNPVAGAQVYSSDGDGPQYTDENGEVVFAQEPGTEYYFANTTSNDAYQAGIDRRSGDVTVTEFQAENSSLEATSKDGAAFDFDENDTIVPDGTQDDILVQVKDQAGNDADTEATQSLDYHWVITPFDADEDQVRVPATGEDSETGSTDGEYAVDFPSGEPSGTYELFASLGEVPVTGGGDIAESKVLTVKAGEADVVYDEANPEVATAGTSEDVTGALELEDGTGLAGRGLTFDYHSFSAGSDATLEEDSGTADDGDIITGADGSFAFTIVDPTETPQDAERGHLDITAFDETEDDDNVGSVDADGNQEVVFAADAAPDGSEISLDGDTGTDMPGDVKDVDVYVEDADGNDVTNTQVELTVDEGYFTNAAGTADFGQSITVATDDSGNATAYLTIGRNAGFDDDGDVTSTVTAESGDATDSEEYEWTTDGTTEGTVDLVFSDQQTVTVLPMAPYETEDVNLDVFTYDEFGNAVDDVEVLVEGDFVNASNSSSAILVDSDLANNVDLTVSQTGAGDEEYTATWVDAVVTDDGNEDAEDSETVEWYEIVVTDASLTASGTNPHPVGSTVTMTYKAVDQNGEPIDGYFVDFFRAGPDDTNVGEPQNANPIETNAQGEAYYVFQGEVAGNATITAVLYDTAMNLDPAGEATRNVVFGGGNPDGKDPISAKLKGKNNGALPKDKLKAFAPKKAAGATVSLFKIKKNGKKFIVATKTANDKGNAFFRVNDRNGAKKTTYRAKYRPTPTTKRDWTNKRTVR